MNENEKRVSLIRRVLRAEDDFLSVIDQLSAFDWDFDGEPVLLEKNLLRDVLERFVDGQLNRESVYRWADFLELREDVDYRPEDEAVLSGMVHELANPETEGSLSAQRAKVYLDMLV